MSREAGGWPKGRPRKLSGPIVHRITICLTSDDLCRLDMLRRRLLAAVEPAAVSDGDVVRWALAEALATKSGHGH
jgi:hypothetical protein